MAKASGIHRHLLMVSDLVLKSELQSNATQKRLSLTCDDNFVFSFPRLLPLNKSKCSKSNAWPNLWVTWSKNHVIHHCRKLEMAYETTYEILFINSVLHWKISFLLTGNRFGHYRESRSTWSSWWPCHGFFSILNVSPISVTNIGVTNIGYANLVTPTWVSTK